MSYQPAEPSSSKFGKVAGGLLLLAVFLLVAAFSAGRFSAPEVVREVAVDRWHTVDLTTEDLTRGFTFAKQVERVVYRNVITTITSAPDAGTVTTITDNTIEREGSSEKASETEALKRVEIVEVEKEKVVERTVTLRPRFRASLLAGASIREPLLPLYGPLVLGAQFDFRIVGGFSVGLWLNTFGAGGVAASVEF